MADQRGVRDKRKEPPVLEVEWGLPLALAPDNTYSTTVYAHLRGWWPGGRPTTADIAVHSSGQKKYGATVQFQRGDASYPLLGLLPGHHYLIVVKVSNLEIQKLLVVEKPEVEDTTLKDARKAADLADLGLKKTKAEAEIKKLAEPTPRTPSKIYVTFTGERGSYRFLVSGSDDKGLIPGLVISVVDGVRITTCEADAGGTAVFNAHFNEPDRYIEFRVGNEHNTIWRNRLPGPKQPNQLTLV